MQEWWVAYYSKPPENAQLEQHKPGHKPDLKEFARVALDGQIGGRDFAKMWVVERDAYEDNTIIVYCGQEPPVDNQHFHGGVVVEGVNKKLPMHDRRAPKRNPAG